MREYKSLTKYILLNRMRYRVLILAASFVSAMLGILSPYFQKGFIDFLMYDHSYLPSFLTFSSPLPYLFLSVFFLVLSQLLNQVTNYIGVKEALFMQKKIGEKIYDKMLSLKLDTMTKRPLGEIVSLYATDVSGATVYLDQTLPSGSSTFFPLLITPFVLVTFFDTPIFFTLVVVVAITALNTLLAFRQSKFFYMFKTLAAERLGFVNEWVQNIRTLRILGWVEIIEQKIINKREVETRNRVKMVTNGQMMNSISTSFTFIVNVVTLSLLVIYYKRDLSPGEIFALLWILGVFLTRPFRQMPWFFTFAFDAATSIARIETFLSAKNKFDVREAELKDLDSKNILEIEGLKLSIQDQEILNVDSFKVAKGQHAMIVGEVGSGKSLLLLSLLGETNCEWTRYVINRKFLTNDIKNFRNVFSYVPQEGLIVSTTLRDNIFLQYDAPKDRDDKVTQAILHAQFKKDMAVLENGLETEFGERGVNLSGGQKQRINIARAAFDDRDIIVLDDSFSALDSETEHLVFTQLVNGAWKNKTVIMTTHRLNLLVSADVIHFMQNGRIKISGSYSDLINKEPDFRLFCNQLAENTSPDFVEKDKGDRV
ncbi:MAG: ABC transporter ATP-binding protein [Bdellovibrionaceae bacterium]|nr:ABC transporter ATP-binding protein [Pseudobdellovibrionaceae bacterium]